MAIEDVEIEVRWSAVKELISKTFGPVEDVKDIVFLIGIQELGAGFRTLTKDQKVDVMHVGLCTLLEPYGYYNYLGVDEDGWPHFELQDNLPNLKEAEQEALVKRAIIDYFESRP